MAIYDEVMADASRLLMNYRSLIIPVVMAVIGISFLLRTRIFAGEVRFVKALESAEYHDICRRSRLQDTAWFIGILLIVSSALLIAVGTPGERTARVVAAILLVGSFPYSCYLVASVIRALFRHRRTSKEIKTMVVSKDMVILGGTVLVCWVLYEILGEFIDHESGVLASLALSLFLVQLLGLVYVGAAVMLQFPRQRNDNDLPNT